MNIPKGSQALILPINSCVFSAGYKNKAYLSQQGYSHYGVDLFADNGNMSVFACGDGEVIECGLSGKNGVYSGLGNVCVIVYKNVYIHSTNQVKDISCRMFHFSSVFVKKGQKVTKDTIIGNYGNTGGTLVNGKRMGAHLHIEFDSDVEYPCYAYGVGSCIYDSIIRKGTIDSTINPSNIWYIDDNQSIWGKYSGWFTDKDINLPKFTHETVDEPPSIKEVERLNQEIASLKNSINTLEDNCGILKLKIKKASEALM